MAKACFTKVEGWKSLQELWDEFMMEAKERGKWYPLYESATTYIDKLKAIRLYYMLHEDRILKYCKEDLLRWYDAYPVDWTSLFTPIEKYAWNSIRSKGQIVLYPQYPVLGYFIDFANPYLKIGLELDGKAYHNKNQDLKRDNELKQIGWRIYRVTGSEMHNNSYKDFYDFDEESLTDYYHVHYDETVTEIKNWLINTGDGVIESIKQVHFLKTDVHEDWWVKFCYDSLLHHSLL